MSIFKINQTDFQTVTVATNPSKFYSSGSGGATGSLHIFARRSNIEKEVRPLDTFSNSQFSDVDLLIELDNIKNIVNSNILNGQTGSSYFNNLEKYLADVNEQSISQKKQKTLDIKRILPTPVSGAVENSLPGFNYFSDGYQKKLIIKENLSEYYRTAYPSAHWGYSNYHSLNFFSSSAVPTGSVFLYPNFVKPDHIPNTFASGVYLPTSSFSFDFHINPRYKNLDSTGHFKAGTIFHLSSTYAVSLITGSQKDLNGNPIGFRLMLQLSHSADVPPSIASPGSYPNDLIFLSDDNSLKWNNWHHTVIRWGTSTVNQGTGSFLIDGIEKGTFNIPSSTIAPLAFNNAVGGKNPAALCIGNYYEGQDGGSHNSTMQQAAFFTETAKSMFGTKVVSSSIANYPLPLIEPQYGIHKFRHQLQCELHDLAIKNSYITDGEAEISRFSGFENVKNEDFLFYLPPFFVEDTFIASVKFLGSNYPQGYAGGNPVSLTHAEYNGGNSPFKSTTTGHPFNPYLAFLVNGHFINTQNFLKDFVNDNFPRQIMLNFAEEGNLRFVDMKSSGKTGDDYLYDRPNIRKRNLSILPCDDGTFYPKYELLESESKNLCVDDLGSFLPGYINLSKLSKNVDQTQQDFESLVGSRVGPYVKNDETIFEYATGQFFQTFRDAESINEVSQRKEKQNEAPLSDILRTKDPSSNQVTIFDLSNLYYGISILPGSFTITDNSLSGSGGSIKITLKDDGRGALYRADSLTDNCMWNAAGTIFYNEGVVVIKNPHLYLFGKDGFEMSFKGEQNLHVLRFDIVAPANFLNSSSNPTYIDTPSTLRANEYDSKFVYVTGINFHDDNLNVIMKTQLAQPIMKRNSDKIAFKVKYDF
jgi:hypothetical protein